MNDQEISHPFKKIISTHWHSYHSKDLLDLITVYDIKEMQQKQINFADDTYTNLHEVCLKSYKEDKPSEEYVNNFAKLCTILPTTILMYFMQNLHAKNTKFFELLSHKLRSDADYEACYMRCIAFEKNWLLSRTLSSTRLSIAESVIKKIMEDGHEI